MNGMRNFRILRYVLVLQWVLLDGLATPSFLAQAAQESLPILESIEGASSIRVVDIGGAARTVQAGAKLRVGDQVEPPEKIAVRLLYDDGTQLVLAGKSRLVIEAMSAGIRWNRLSSGKLRARVPSAGDDSALPKKYRFGTRTRSAVLGVRGTDYFVRIDKTGKFSEFVTFEGVVDIHNSEKQLLSGKGVPVPQGELIRSTIGKLSDLKKWDRDQFMKAVEKEDPSFARLIEKPLNSASKPPSE